MRSPSVSGKIPCLFASRAFSLAGPLELEAATIGVREYGRRYRVLNKDKLRDSKRRYRIENKNKVRAYYTQSNDAMKEYHRDYQTRNKSKVNESNRLYYSRNLDKRRDDSRLYKERRKELKRQSGLGHSDNLLPDHALKSWKSPELVREYFDSIAKQLHISDHTDWYRVSRPLVDGIGGRSLYTTFGNLGAALQFAYPEIAWDLEKFSLRGKKAGQRWLKVMIEELLPGTEVVEDYLHPLLIWDRHVELDLWIPEHQIAIELQGRMNLTARIYSGGEHHFYSVDNAFGPNGTSSLYSDRDIVKSALCQTHGVTLIIIPYWWQGDIGSLSATLYRARPDVFPVSTSSPIPDEILDRSKNAGPDLESALRMLQWKCCERPDVVIDFLDYYRHVSSIASWRKNETKHL